MTGGTTQEPAAGHDVGPPDWPDMLVLHLRIGGVERPIIRNRRAEPRLRPLGFSIRVRAPPRVAFDDPRHAPDIPAQPDRQVLVHNLRLDPLFEALLCHP